jgi:hypothetical protein
MTWFDYLGRDLRQATRAIVRMPVLATVVVVSLAIGIGVNAAIFSWIEGLVFKPLPGVRDAASFQLIEPRSDIGSHVGTSWLEYRDLRERLTSFREILAYKMVPLTIGTPPNTVRAYGQLVSANYFRALGLEPSLGRFPTPDEVSVPGGQPVVVVSDGFWKTRLGGASDVVGRRDRGQRAGPHRHWRRPAQVPGHGDDARLRPLDPGDDGAGAVHRVARARGPRLARIRYAGAAQT